MIADHGTLLGSFVVKVLVIEISRSIVSSTDTKIALAWIIRAGKQSTIVVRTATWDNR